MGTAPCTLGMLCGVHAMQQAKLSCVLLLSALHQMQGVLRCRPVVIGPHTDGKNVAGSYSALMVCEVGDPVAGGFYMLPQYRAALDIRQGLQWQHLPCCWSNIQYIKALAHISHCAS